MADAELEEVHIYTPMALSNAAYIKRSEKPALRNCRRKQDEVEAEDQVKAPTRNRDTDARQALLSQILLPEAADRLGRIRMVKEDRAADIENRLIMLARTGQLRAKVTEEQLKELLNAIAENKEEEKIVISRRKGGWDDDDDDLLDL
ncbi:programmed cell death protein 5 [[Emmonsia] crescens]|uniref:Programmed cell death protein 5 n=2 Tax=[Emmonsia] crescens TaxID=73230 RepID=A0A2B7ZME0_9EURO|nr:programmed cell death protein 5 [Emmonsia crescens]